MRLQPLPAAIILILLAPAAQARSITGVSYEGTCGRFTVNVSAESLEGCWDVKLDVPGQVFNPTENKWQSTFYYVDRWLCQPEGSAVLDVILSGSGPEVNGTARLRQGSAIIERPFTIRQECPEPLGWEWSVLVAMAVILLFGYMLVWWWRRGRE